MQTTDATPQDWDNFWTESDPAQTNQMTAQSPNNVDLYQLKENYINHIIDGMDVDSLAQMAYDLLLDSYEDCTWDDITEEIVDLYDEDTLVTLLPV